MADPTATPDPYGGVRPQLTQTGTATGGTTDPGVGTGTEIAQTLADLNNVDANSLVLARRMTSLQRKNPGITASLAFDAASGVNDSTSNTVDLGPNLPSYATPNALSVLVSNTLGSSTLAPITDMRAYQQNLQALGYITDPNWQPTGNVDQQTLNASYQHISDVAGTINQGKGRLLSMSATDGLRLLNATMPTNLWKTFMGVTHGIVKSFSNTGKDLWLGGTNLPGVLFGGETGTQLNDKIQQATGRRFGLGALGEDAANVLTIASLATGIGELGAVVGGVGDLMGVAADQGLGAVIRPVAGDAGYVARGFGSLVSQAAGDEAKQSITEFFGKYGPKAIARSPLMELVGRGYGAARWTLFPQAALSTFEPNSSVGAAAAKTHVPWWVDAPVIFGVMHPEEGMVKQATKLLRVGQLRDAVGVTPEFLLGLGKDAHWTNGQYSQLATGAYLHAIVTGQAGDAATYAGIGTRDAAAWKAAQGKGGAFFATHVADQMDKLVNRVVESIDDPLLRRVSPQFAQEATAWAGDNPSLISAHYQNIVNAGHMREANNLTGVGEWDSFDNASRAADELSRTVTPQMVQEAMGTLFHAQRTAPEATALVGEGPPGRVLAMRADNPAYRQNLQNLIGRWKVATEGVWSTGPAPRVQLQAPNPTEIAAIEKEVAKIPEMVGVNQQDWVSHLTHLAAKAPTDITDLLSQGPTSTEAAVVSDAEQLARLKHGEDLTRMGFKFSATDPIRRGPLNIEEQKLVGEYRDWASTQRAQGRPIALPTEAGPGRGPVVSPDLRSYTDHFASLGYRPVYGGTGVLLPSDMGPFVMEAPKMKTWEYALAQLGMGTQMVDANALAHSTQMARANEYAAELDPSRWGYGTGERMLQDVSRTFSQQMGDRASLVGGGVTKVGRMVDRVGRTVQASQGPSQAFIRSVLEGDTWGLTQTESKMMGRALYSAMRDGAAGPGLVTRPSGMFNIMHTLAAGMRVNGLAGISDTMRAFTLGGGPTIEKTAIGALAGAGIGATAGKGLKGVLAGAGIGAATTTLAGGLPDHYGHLFDVPMRIAQTLRFQLNPMFEARKLTKGEMLAGEYEGLAPSLRPYKAMQAEDPMGRLANTGGPALPRDVAPTGYDIQPGGKLIDRYSQIFTRTQGQDVAAVTDIDKAFKDSGVLGYNLQHHGIYDVGRIWDKQFSASLAAGKSAEDATTIADTYAQAHGPKMYTFGPQSPIARSANFLFFPFSFELKAATAAADYLTADPVRLFLTHELARRAGLVDTTMTPGQKSKLGQLVDRYAPVMNDVQKLNPWKYGIGPGEFLGLYKPIAEALALPVENVANVLHPGVIPADKVTTFKQLVPRMLSGYKAIGTFWNDVNSQAHVLTSPKHESMKTEINDYYTNKDGLDALYSQMGVPFGTDGSIAAFRQSQKVPVFMRQQYITDLTKLQALYPAGPQHAAMISNHAQIQSNQIDSILQKVTQTTPEKGITTLEATRLQLNQLYTLSQQAPVMKHIVHDLETTQMRTAAIRLFEGMGRSDQVAFNSLWQSLGYETQYGPLAVPVVSGREPGTS